MGDGEAGVDYPAFVDGERRRPPEDVDGIPSSMEFLRRGARPLHVEHNEVVTWYAKPFDLVDLEERWVRLRPATPGGPPPECPREASRRSAVRFDLTRIWVSLWPATGRQPELELLSTVLLRTDCYGTAGTGRRRSTCRTRRCL